MSYILDALRKADAERRGVAAPVGLTEPAVLVATDDNDNDLPASRGAAWWWVGGGAAVALAAAVGWHVWRGAATPEPAAPPQAAVAPPVAPPAPPPAPAPAQPPVAPAADADALPRFPPPLPEPPARSPAPPPPRDMPRQGAREPLPTLPPATGQQQDPAARSAPPPGITPVNPAPAPAADRVWALAELPEGVRRDFPKLTVNGAMYSERPSDRMVIINGQVLHEGERFGELTVRQVRLKAAVLDFRGYRVQITW